MTSRRSEPEALVKTCRLLTASLVVSLSAVASAQDASVLNKKDDLEFARALRDNGYPDLAERLVVVIEKQGGGSGGMSELIRLDIAQDNAMKIDDLVKRKDALVKVLADKIKFANANRGTPAAEDCRNRLPDLYGAIGEAITAAIRKEKDDVTLNKLRDEGDKLFLQAEEASKAREAEAKAEYEKDPTNQDAEFAYQAASYNACRTLYLHSLLFTLGSGKRNEMIETALKAYDEFDLNFSDTIFNIYAAIDTGNCLKDLGKSKEALDCLDRAISVRESYGEKVKDAAVVKAGEKPRMVWPIGTRDIADIVAYGMFQKMLVLQDMKQTAEMIAVAEDYDASIPDSWELSSALNIYRELAEAKLAAGDTKGCLDIAAKMQEVDPNGLMGATGRELKDRAGGGTFRDKLTTAEARLMANDYDRAFALCREVLSDTAGTPDAQEGGCMALLTIGFGYQKRGWIEEAALAYQTAVDRFPKATGAPEALARAIDCYSGAQRAGRRKFYKDQIEEDMNRLVRDYPKDQRAQQIQITQAEILENEGDFTGAISKYETIAPASNAYTKARLKIGLCYFLMGDKLSKEKDSKKEDVNALLAKTESGLKEAVTAIGTARGKTIDPGILKALEEQEWVASLSLAKLYMTESFGKLAAAAPMIDTLESRWGKDPAKGPQIQDLRGRLFLSQGKYEEAEKWVSDLWSRDKKGAAGPAGQLARSFDQMGLDKLTAKPDSLEGEDLWKRAAKYYYMSIKPQVDGTVTQDADEMAKVGGRFYIYGRHFNGVTDERVTFIDWSPASRRTAEYWTKAAEIYESTLQIAPDIKVTINLGRTYGYLASLGDHPKWVEAARVYGKLFEQEPLVNQKNRQRLDPQMVKAKPELVFAYVEWGVCERLAFAVDGDKGRINRCLGTIFQPLRNSLRPDTSGQAYWASRYHEVAALMDIGEYPNAKLTIEDIQRQVSPTFDEGKYGYKALFEKAYEELKKK
jgi:tetratricopeptide (TPR) repeat protein